MALPNVGVVSTQDLTTLFTAVDTAFNHFKFDEETVADKFSYVSTQRGRLTVLPFSSPAGREEIWPLGTDRKKMDPQIFEATVTNDRIAPPDEQVFQATLDWDRYQILSGNLAKFTSRAKRIWDRQLASMIIANPLSYDGVSVFNTAHPVNPVAPALGTYSNDLTGTDLDEAGLTSAIQAMAQVRWLDGNIIAMPMTDMYVVTGSKALELKARKLIWGTLTPQAGTAANTSVAASNVMPGMKGMIKDVIYLPELIDPTDVTNSSKRWYLVNASDVGFRPFVVNIVHWPLFHFIGLSPNDYTRVRLGAVSYGWEANGGVAPGAPQMVVRATTP